MKIISNYIKGVETTIIDICSNLGYETMIYDCKVGYNSKKHNPEKMKRPNVSYIDNKERKDAFQKILKNSDATLIVDFTQKRDNVMLTNYCILSKWNNGTHLKMPQKVYQPFYVLNDFNERNFSDFYKFLKNNKVEVLNVCGDTYVDEHHVQDLVNLFDAVGCLEEIETNDSLEDDDMVMEYEKNKK